MTDKELAWLIRRDVFEMMYISKSAHIASCFSMADFLAYLFNSVIDKEKDHFVLSKGHAGAAYYAALAELNYFDRKMLLTYCQDESLLSGHISHHVPGVEVSTGSLGHGASIACGMAYSLKKDNKIGHVYTVIGDGECDEGSIWEMCLFANQFKLGNFVIIVDRNKMQSLQDTEDTIALESLFDKLKSFNLDVQEIDGHDFDKIKKAFNNIDCKSNKPHVIIMDTVKGKGISFMEHDILWHYRYPHDGDEYNKGLQELLNQKPSSLVSPYPQDKEDK